MCAHGSLPSNDVCARETPNRDVFVNSWGLLSSPTPVCGHRRHVPLICPAIVSCTADVTAGRKLGKLFHPLVLPSVCTPVKLLVYHIFTFLYSHRTVFTFHRWVDLLGIVLAFGFLFYNHQITSKLLTQSYRYHNLGNLF